MRYLPIYFLRITHSPQALAFSFVFIDEILFMSSVPSLFDLGEYHVGFQFGIFRFGILSYQNLRQVEDFSIFLCLEDGDGGLEFLLMFYF